jgi:hypothetical protein
VSPRSLLTARRFDLVVKHRYFRHLIGGNDPGSERLYRWHILKRTGGNEPKSPKASIEDYIAACKGLVASLSAFGFDKRFPVAIGTNGLPRGGAHRIAACLALGVDVMVRRVDKLGLAWDFEWFVRHGMAADDLDRLAADYKALTR